MRKLVEVKMSVFVDDQVYSRLNDDSVGHLCDLVIDDLDSSLEAAKRHLLEFIKDPKLEVTIQW